jgi:CheY-like chemotaxis protein
MAPPDPPPRVQTILVVDDEPAIRETLAALLEDEGYAVEQATDGLDAFDAIENDAVDLVISDVRMPYLDGPTLVQCLRRGGHAVPVVLMSAAAVPADLPDVHFLRKPFAPERLYRIVASALQPGGAVTGG